MAANLNTLIPDFKSKVICLLDRCKNRGVEMRPCSGVRDPFEQARLWRQSRSIEEINLAIKHFLDNGGDFLAHCLKTVGPQHGDHVTNALPGYSWHQWGEALDSFWLVNGKAEWSTKKLVNGVNGFKVYAEEAKIIGISAGLNWTSFKDAPHIQFRSTSNPGKVISINEINKVMKEKFGD